MDKSTNIDDLVDNRDIRNIQVQQVKEDVVKKVRFEETSQENLENTNAKEILNENVKVICKENLEQKLQLDTFATEENLVILLLLLIASNESVHRYIERVLPNMNRTMFVGFALFFIYILAKFFIIPIVRL